ncbi:efflux transporter outer membrane subunit [Sandaracinobacteroides saxicola]|uniref:Efflux transporter outer membrane subunit n=1 Tax=Sandaracinobacteroides saxicola TaxID=2759707 RepID=A0A7G5IE13_9SPHN|nr:efflux transporter outer membrane subunit [Sandaracinobacteroides saxicola]QMW21605.1 efflux transporter outer membrane subunit [Sandaracinobacteroides saxicola]
MIPWRTQSNEGLRAVIGITSPLFLAGCMVGPDYAALPPPAPPAFVGEPSRPSPLAEAEVPAEWWRTLGDAMLDELVEEALAANLDIATALARIDEARASRTAVAAGLLPQITGSGSVGESSVSRNTPNGAFLPQRTNPSFNLGANVAWETDLFGGLRRSVEAADARIGGAQASADAVRLATASEVARQYVALRGIQTRLAVADDNIAAARALRDVAREKRIGGIGTALDETRAAAQLELARAAAPPLRTAARTLMHGLAVLTAQPPTALMARLETAIPIPQPPLVVAAGLPASVLLRRPDMRVAERTYAAAVANIGVAKVEALPRLTLTGSGGGSSTALSNLLAAPSLVWQALGTLAGPIFDGGRAKSNIVAARARAEQARLTYQQTALVALREVEDALVALQNDRALLETLTAQAEQTSEAVRLTRIAYRGGIADFTTVLDAERTDAQAKDQLANAKAVAASDLIALYRVLGGGAPMGGVNSDPASRRANAFIKPLSENSVTPRQSVQHEANRE